MSTRVEAHEIEQRSFRYFDIVSCAFIAVYLISQVSSAKLIALGPFQFPGAIVIFPFAYIFGDILTECYGYARTRRIIWLGFFAATLMAVVLWVVQELPPAPAWPNQAAYEVILGLVPRVVLGSVLAYWAGEFANSYVLAKMKVWTGGRHLWTRTIGSTVVGQAIDSIVFISIVFVGRIPLGAILRVIGSVYLFKVTYEAAATPLTYWIVNRIKHAEGIDVYDTKTNLSPFKLS
jgi:hypothetical protein